MDRNMDSKAVCVTSDNSVRKSDISMPSTSSNCTFTTAIDQSSNILSQDQPKHENNNIDLNALMNSFRDLDDSNESFDFNKIKSESYNFLDDPEYGVNEMMINTNTDSYDVHDLISMSSSEPTHIERLQTQTDSQIPTNNTSDKSEVRESEQTLPQTVSPDLAQLSSPITESGPNDIVPHISENSDSESNDYKYVFIPRMLDDENELSDEEMVETPNNAEHKISITTIQSPQPDINDDSLDDLEIIKESIESEHNYSTKSLRSLLCHDNEYSSGDETTVFPNIILNTDGDLENLRRNNETIDILPIDADATTSNTISNETVNVFNANENKTKTVQPASLNQNALVNETVDNLTNNAAAPNEEDTENMSITPAKPASHDNEIPVSLENTTPEVDDNLPVSNQSTVRLQKDVVPTETTNDSEEDPSDLFSEIHSEPLEYRLRNATDFDSSYAFAMPEVYPENDNDRENIDVMTNNISSVSQLTGADDVEEPPRDITKTHIVGDPEMDVSGNDAGDGALQSQEAVAPDKVMDSNVDAKLMKLENDISNNIDPKLNESLLKLEKFGEKIKESKTHLLTNISKNTLEADSLCNEFATTLEIEFKELLKEFRIITRRNQVPLEMGKNESKSVEEPANALKLNQKSKERWLAASSSSSEQNDSDCDDSEEIPKFRQRVKRRRLLESSETEQLLSSTQTTDDVIQGIRKNTKLRLGSDSDDDTDDSQKTQISLEPKFNSPQKNLNSQVNSDNDETEDIEARTTESIDYIGMAVQSPPTILTEPAVLDIDENMDEASSKPWQESIDYSPSYDKDMEQKNEDSEMPDTLNNESGNELPVRDDIEANKDDIEPNKDDIEPNKDKSQDCESIHDKFEKEHRSDDVLQSTDNDDVVEDNNEELPEDNDKEPIKPSATIHPTDNKSLTVKTKSTADSIDDLDLGEFLLSGTSTICSEDMIEREPQHYDLPPTTSEMPVDDNLTQILVKNEPLNESNPNNVTIDDCTESAHDPVENLVPRIMYNDFESDFEGFTQKEDNVTFETEIKMEENNMPAKTIELSAIDETEKQETESSVIEPLLNETDDESNEQNEVKLENIFPTTNNFENEEKIVNREEGVQNESDETKSIPIDAVPEEISADNNTVTESEALAAIEEYSHINTEDMLAEFNTYTDEPTDDVLPLPVTNVSDEGNNDGDLNQLEELSKQIEDNVVEASLQDESAEVLNQNVDNEESETIDEKNASDADIPSTEDEVHDDDPDNNKKDDDKQEDVAIESDGNDDYAVVDGEPGAEDAEEEEQEDEQEVDVDDLRDKEIDK